jgi:hypothetical protein
MADISRDDLATIIQEEYSNELLAAATTSPRSSRSSARWTWAPKVNLPVLATLPEAEFVSESATEDAGKKPTSQACGATSSSWPRRSP